MPWNDNANGGQKPGPWGSPPPSGGGSGGGGSGNGGSGGSGGGNDGGPKGGGPRKPPRPGSTPPDFGDLGKQLKAQWDKLAGSGGGGGGASLSPRTLGMIAGGVAGLWALSGLYINQANERAVVSTFAAYTMTTGPGLNYHLPYPFQSHRQVAVTDLNRTLVGGAGEGPNDDGQMLTGDLNIVDLDFTVLWRVNNAKEYVYNLPDPDGTVKSVAEASMREVVGHTDLEPVLTTGRAKVESETQVLIQKLLNEYRSGIRIEQVQIRQANPPADVTPAFREVQSAKQEAESTANKARAEAANIQQEALGYRARVVQEAQGEAARFNQVYAEYKLAPAVTRQRLYLETMERVMGRSKRVIVDGNAANAPIILPGLAAPAPAPASPAVRPGAAR